MSYTFSGLEIWTSTRLILEVCLCSWSGTWGIFFPPFSEAFGRETLSSLQHCCTRSSASSQLQCLLLLPLSPVDFIRDILSAIPIIVVAGSIEDVFNIQGWVWTIFCWALVGNIGLSVGPIFTLYVTERLSWCLGLRNFFPHFKCRQVR